MNAAPRILTVLTVSFGLFHAGCMVDADGDMPLDDVPMAAECADCGTAGGYNGDLVSDAVYSDPYVWSGLTSGQVMNTDGTLRSTWSQILSDPVVARSFKHTFEVDTAGSTFTVGNTTFLGMGYLFGEYQSILYHAPTMQQALDVMTMRGTQRNNFAGVHIAWEGLNVQNVSSTTVETMIDEAIFVAFPRPFGPPKITVWISPYLLDHCKLPAEVIGDRVCTNGVSSCDFDIRDDTLLQCDQNHVCQGRPGILTRLDKLDLGGLKESYVKHCSSIFD